MLKKKLKKLKLCKMYFPAKKNCHFSEVKKRKKERKKTDGVKLKKWYI
jgi:hypothetical protein